MEKGAESKCQLLAPVSVLPDFSGMVFELALVFIKTSAWIFLKK